MDSLINIPLGTVLCPSNKSYAFSVSLPSYYSTFTSLLSPKLLSSSLCCQKKVHAGNLQLLVCRNYNGGSFETAPGELSPQSTSDLVRDFCSAINTKDVQKLNTLLGEDCLFMDLIFYLPYGGKQNTVNFLCDVMDSMGPNVHFAIDTLIEEQNFTATLTWHLEWKGKEIPFTSSCFLFECEQIHDKLFIRKIVGLEELPVKPGELVLKLLKATTSTFDNFPMAAEGFLKKVKAQGKSGGLQMLIDFITSKTKNKP